MLYWEKRTHLKLCAIFLDIERCSDNASIYFPSKDIPFTRLYEPKNRSNYMAPKRQTCIVVEFPYNPKLNTVSYTHLTLPTNREV